MLIGNVINCRVFTWIVRRCCRWHITLAWISRINWLQWTIRSCWRKAWYVWDDWIIWRTRFKRLRWIIRIVWIRNWIRWHTWCIRWERRYPLSHLLIRDLNVFIPTISCQTCRFINLGQICIIASNHRRFNRIKGCITIRRNPITIGHSSRHYVILSRTRELDVIRHRLRSFTSILVNIRNRPINRLIQISRLQTIRIRWCRWPSWATWVIWIDWLAWRTRFSRICWTIWIIRINWVTWCVNR
ncbi:hypothetical protein WEIDD23_01618 [Weissella sp. DD23]|nr:hypothetical protein WEIDD23_01618 [Weissella sp. DD23]